MSRVARGSRIKLSAFTLIELLVVVAIIALLISILLPSLGQARAQARTTVCGTRISQMGKSFLLYADDYNEAPPFVCFGRGTEWRYGPDPNENWLVSGMSGAQSIAAIIWNTEDTTWPANCFQTGTLFSYMRYETAYRCPEFERITDPRNEQRKFNYSRCALGRRVRFDANHVLDTSDPNLPYGFGYDGPIMKPSMVFNTSQTPLVVDEAWNGYIGQHGTNNYTWDQCDPIMDIIDSFIGEYHGSPVPGVALVNDAWDLQYRRKSGSLCMYDGHVELQRDFFPRVGGNNEGGGRPAMNFMLDDVMAAVKRLLGIMFYSQQGVRSPLD
jgi:prepilin-type N-terminal cleavage/methylation domain-containing protein